MSDRPDSTTPHDPTGQYTYVPRWFVTEGYLQCLPSHRAKEGFDHFLRLCSKASLSGDWSEVNHIRDTWPHWDDEQAASVRRVIREASRL